MTPVLYLANPSTPSIVDAMLCGRLGYIDTPRQRNATAGRILHRARVPWCADNGCFTDGWDSREWWAFLEDRAEHAASCLFAVAPDVVANAQATLELSRPWLVPIRELGYPVAFVAQDGLEERDAPWDEFDVLFIGGSTGFKLGPRARELAASAHARGKRVHVGRVNSLRRLRYCSASYPYGLAAESADGTHLRFAPDDNLPRLLSWFPRLSDPVLFT